MSHPAVFTSVFTVFTMCPPCCWRTHS